jgi:hypothetical protein
MNSFDWKYYLDTYPDLRANNITTEDTALLHWNNHGRAEGRIPIKTLRFFDWKYYLNTYPDLRANNITTEQDALQHWYKHGEQERRKPYNFTNNVIIGYIHICQIGQWQRSFKMLINCIKKSGLYDSTNVIRLGIVNNMGVIIRDPILNDKKFNIIYIGRSAEYERPTLLHMRKSTNIDAYNTVYYYLHTKGVTHFGKDNEQYIIDWINLMLYWNIEKWKIAIEKLNIYDTYGCNDIGHHYSGNFWWATRTHISKLPKTIPSYYTAPEDWIQIIRTNKFSIFNSGVIHYTTLFPRDKYENC